MHVTLNALQNRAVSFAENFFSSLTAQQKKILLVAAIALSSLTTLCLIWRCCFTAKEMAEDDLDDDTQKVDQQKEKITPRASPRVKTPPPTPKEKTPEVAPTKNESEKEALAPEPKSNMPAINAEYVWLDNKTQQVMNMLYSKSWIDPEKDGQAAQIVDEFAQFVQNASPDNCVSIAVYFRGKCSHQSIPKDCEENGCHYHSYTVHHSFGSDSYRELAVSYDFIKNCIEVQNQPEEFRKNMLKLVSELNRALRELVKKSKETDSEKERKVEELNTKEEKVELELKELEVKDPPEAPQIEVVKDEKTRNILIIGRSRSGKTTLRNLLQDLSQVVEMGSIFYQTREPEVHELDLSGYKIRMLDTPGLCEYARKGEKTRSNVEIVEMIKGKVKEIFGGKDFENVDTVLMTFTVDSGINSEDIVSMETCLPLLPPKTKKILVITYAESYDDQACENIRSQLARHPQLAKLVHTYFRGVQNVLFTGALEQFDLEFKSTTVRKLGQIHRYREQLITELLPEAEVDDLKKARLEKTAEKTKVFLDKHFPKETEAEQAETQLEPEPTLEVSIDSFVVDTEEQLSADPTIEGHLDTYDSWPNTPAKAYSGPTAEEKKTK